jgi:hypothetical protein
VLRVSPVQLAPFLLPQPDPARAVHLPLGAASLVSRPCDLPVPTRLARTHGPMAPFGWNHPASEIRHAGRHFSAPREAKTAANPVMLHVFPMVQALHMPGGGGRTLRPR